MFEHLSIVSGSLPIGGTPTGQSIVGAGPFISTDAIDLGSARDIGFGSRLMFGAQIVAAVTGPTVVRFEAITASDGALTTNVVGRGSVEVPVAQLTAGALVVVQINPEMRANTAVGRFMGMRYTLIGGSASAGSVLAGIIRGYSGMRFSRFASGFSVA
jgi:hypothetical protein